MHLNDSDRRSINSASIYIADTITKRIEELHPQLMSKFNLTGRQLNVAIAKSSIILMISCATAAAADTDNKHDVPDIVTNLATQLETILYDALGVES